MNYFTLILLQAAPGGDIGSIVSSLLPFILIVSVVLLVIKLRKKNSKKVFPQNVKKNKNYDSWVSEQVIPTYNNDISKPQNPIETLTPNPIIQINKEIISGITSKEFIEEMNKYKKLFEKNMLSFTEYSEMKASLINEIETKGVSGSKTDFLLDLSEIKNDILTSEEINRIKNLLGMTK